MFASYLSQVVWRPTRQPQYQIYNIQTLWTRYRFLVLNLPLLTLMVNNKHLTDQIQAIAIIQDNLILSED